MEDDGCLSSLRVDGVEFLHPGLSVSRGLYFLHGQPERMTDVRQPAANVLTAENAETSIRYEFGPDQMTWTLENKSNDAMPFFCVFDAGVIAGRVGADGWVKAPAASKDFADPKTSNVSLVRRPLPRHADGRQPRLGAVAGQISGLGSLYGRRTRSEP